MNENNYQQTSFATQGDEQLWGKVSIKKKRGKTWAGVMAFLPNQLPIWFAFNTKTGEIRHGRKFHAIWMKQPKFYDHILGGVHRWFSLKW